VCKISSGKQRIVILLRCTTGVPSMRAPIGSFVICRQGGMELSVSEFHSLFVYDATAPSGSWPPHSRGF